MVYSNKDFFIIKKSKWLRESLESSSLFAEQLESIELYLPEIAGEGLYEVEAKTLEGVLDLAFHVPQWLGVEVSTIIYHL